MPTYEYACDTCGAGFELFQSFSDDTLKKCPGKRSGGPVDQACTSPGKGKVNKVFSAVGISFKGDGFYKNDSAKGERKSSSSSSDSSSGESTTSSSTDSSSSDKKSSDKSEKSDKADKPTKAESTTKKSSEKTSSSKKSSSD